MTWAGSSCQFSRNWFMPRQNSANWRRCCMSSGHALTLTISKGSAAIGEEVSCWAHLFHTASGDSSPGETAGGNTSRVPARFCKRCSTSANWAAFLASIAIICFTGSATALTSIDHSSSGMSMSSTVALAVIFTASSPADFRQNLLHQRVYTQPTISVVFH